MNAAEHQVEQGNPEKRLDEARARREQEPGTEKPPVKQEHKDRASEMANAYQDDRPTVTMPDTGGTVAGTAVSDWVDHEKKGDKPQR